MQSSILPINSPSFFESQKSINRLSSLTLPSTDVEERIIQLWKRGESQIVGAVWDLDGKFSVIPQQKISNPAKFEMIQGLDSPISPGNQAEVAYG